MNLKLGKVPATAVLAVLLCAMPHVARADGSAPDLSNCTQPYSSNTMAEAQAKANAGLKVYTSQPPLDIKNNYCWDSIGQAFSSISSLSGGIFATVDMTDPLGGILSGVLGNLFSGALNSILNSLCTQVAGTLNSLTSGLSLTNQLCIPLPSMNFNLGMAGLTGGGGACNGTSLLTITGGVSNGQQGQPGMWSIWSQGQ